MGKGNHGLTCLSAREELQVRDASFLVRLKHLEQSSAWPQFARSKRHLLHYKFRTPSYGRDSCSHLIRCAELCDSSWAKLAQAVMVYWDRTTKCSWIYTHRSGRLEFSQCSHDCKHEEFGFLPLEILHMIAVSHLLFASRRKQEKQGVAELLPCWNFGNEWEEKCGSHIERSHLSHLGARVGEGVWGSHEAQTYQDERGPKGVSCIRGQNIQ